MREITLRDQIRYRFDILMSKGTAALMGWLFAISAIVIIAAATVIAAAGLAPAAEDGTQPGFAELMWTALMRTLDAGNLAGDTGSRGYVGVLFVVTAAGIFLVSILIGLLTSGIEARLEEMRKGRSFVCERGHTLILGWSNEIYSVISETMIANQSRSQSAIVILADRDKVEMEDDIRAQVGVSKHTRVVCRTGNPIDPVDLAVANPNDARSIILLAPEGEEADAQVIKMILALTNNPERRKEPYHIVAELRNRRNLDVAKLVGRDEAQLLLVSDLIASITVQTCRQSGLSVVYTELLDFEGVEIYTHEEPGLVGKAFGDALSMYETSAVMGLRRRDGTVLLNPDHETRFEPGDRVIAISEDDSTLKLSGRPGGTVQADAIRTAPETVREPERTLILGWNRRGELIVRELGAYVAPGSKVHVVASTDPDEAMRAQLTATPNVEVTFEVADSTSREVLDRLDIPSYDHVITLSYSDELEVQQADARTLMTLLHLRDIAAKKGADFSVVSEMLDVKNRQLAEVTKADDFIVSGKLVSLMLSQVAENQDLTAVFEDLFDPEGSEIYLKPASEYVEPGRALDFYTVVEAARRRGQVAIGYRRQVFASDAAKGYGVVVSPNKAERVTYEERDKIIVLAAD